MRNIKFRGKRIDNGEWVHGYLVLDFGENDAPRIIIDRQYSSGANYIANAPRVAHDSVGQYTGLHDKNGVEIYEGDIIQGFLSYTQEDRAFIEYEEENMGFVTVPAFDEMYGRDFEIQDSEDIEVIGNVFDNPELLEGDKQ